jgi:hypothetical protein
MQRRVRERLKNFKDYDDFLKNFEQHRDKHEARAHLLREEGFKDLNDKFPDYDMRNAEKHHSHKYNSYSTDKYVEGYWDSKANDLYWSQSTLSRTWLQIKKVGDFYRDIAVLWALLGGLCLFFNAKQTSKKMNCSKSYSLIRAPDSSNSP